MKSETARYRKGSSHSTFAYDTSFFQFKCIIQSHCSGFLFHNPSNISTKMTVTKQILWCSNSIVLSTVVLFLFVDNFLHNSQLTFNTFQKSFASIRITQLNQQQIKAFVFSFADLFIMLPICRLLAVTDETSIYNAKL